MGSELTYSPKSVYTLIKVINKFLKPDGVFYEVLSDDRDVNIPFVSLLIVSRAFLYFSKRLQKQVMNMLSIQYLKSTSETLILVKDPKPTNFTHLNGKNASIQI